MRAGFPIDFQVDPITPEVMYIADKFSGVYRSTDAGQMWQAINNGLMPRSTNALSLSSDGQHLYAATEGGGVFRLDISGQPPLPTATDPNSPE